MRLAAAGYVSGEFGGTYDTVKAVDLLRKAADSGELIAMAQLAYCINTGRGGLTRDDAKTIDYLRRAADAGFERHSSRSRAGSATDISSGKKICRKVQVVRAVLPAGTRSSTSSELAYVHRYAREAPWFDTKRSFELFQLCAPYRHCYCHYWLARAYHEGAGTARDLVKAYAHYTIAQQLGRHEAAAEVQKLDGSLQPADRTAATQLAATISANLKPTPPAIILELPEAEAAGRSPWSPPSSQPAAIPSPAAQPTSADWDTCKGRS